MKKVLIISVIFALLCFSCGSKDAKESNSLVSSNQTSENSVTEKKKETAQVSNSKKYIYVNAEDGIRLRNTPDTNGEKITVIPHKEKLELLENVPDSECEIGGRISSWKKVKTEDGTEGYVFGGFTESTTEKIDRINALEGTFVQYKQKQEGNCITVRYLGDEKFEVVSDIFVFHEKKTVELYELMNSNVFYADLSGKGLSSSVYYIKFDTNTFWLHEEVSNAEVDEDSMDIVKVTSNHYEYILIKQ